MVRTMIMRVLVPFVLMLALSGYAALGQAGEIRDYLQAQFDGAFTEIAAINEADDWEEGAQQQALFKVFATYFGRLFHTTYMSRYVLGKSYRSLSEVEFEAFQDKFTTLFLYTYAGVVAQFDPNNLEILEAVPGHRKNLYFVEVIVKSASDESRAVIQVGRIKDEIRILNVTYEGISLLINYRSAFNDIIASQGFPALLAFLDDRIAFYEQADA